MVCCSAGRRRRGWKSSAVCSTCSSPTNQDQPYHSTQHISRYCHTTQHSTYPGTTSQPYHSTLHISRCYQPTIPHNAAHIQVLWASHTTQHCTYPGTTIPLNTAHIQELPANHTTQHCTYPGTTSQPYQSTQHISRNYTSAHIQVLPAELGCLHILYVLCKKIVRSIISVYICMSKYSVHIL